MRWCIDNGRWPAHSHVHEAPGDDSQFMYKVAPWHPDGSVNPPGVPSTVPDKVDKTRLLTDYNTATGWSCRRCGEWVSVRPREAVGVEPKTWWWCKACKNLPTAATGSGTDNTGIRRFFQSRDGFL